MASFRLLMVSMSDWSMNCHIFSTLRDLEDKEALMHMSCVQRASVHKLVSVCPQPESSQELHDAVVVSHVPTAFSDVDQVGENLPLLLHRPCC